MSHPAIQEIVAVIGQPVAGNPAQFVMEKGFDAVGLDWRCLTLEVSPDGLADAIRGMRALGFRGVMVAPPHRTAVTPLVEQLSKTARLAGQVDCLRSEGADWIGENTLGPALLQTLVDSFVPLGKNVVLLGTGAAARVIGVELALQGAAKLTIVHDATEAASELVALLRDQAKVSAEFAPWIANFPIPPDTDLLVNATTPQGDPNSQFSLDLSTLESDMIVAGVGGGQAAERLLRHARELGCTTCDSLELQAHQAALTFQAWTGQAANAEVLRDALEEFLGV